MFVTAAYFHPSDSNGNDHVPEPAYEEYVCKANQ